jgi:hypothetical protein
MNFGPERIKLGYTIRYRDPVCRKWVVTRWKMTEEDAAKRFADQEYEILWGSEEERKVGGDPAGNSASHVQRSRENEG